MEKAGYCILILATIAWIIAGICGMFQNIWIGIIWVHHNWIAGTYTRKKEFFNHGCTQLNN